MPTSCDDGTGLQPEPTHWAWGSFTCALCQVRAQLGRDFCPGDYEFACCFDLEVQRQLDIWNGRAPSTLKGYLSTQRAIRQFGSRIGVNLFPMHRPPPPAFSLSVILMWYILDAMLSGGRTAIGPQWKGTELLTLIISECIPRTMLRPRSLNLLTA